MLTRVYIDNFRCFVNFEHRPARRELIIGTNGAGKSSFLDAMLMVRQFVMTGIPFSDASVLSQRTRWVNQDKMTFEMEVLLDGEKRYVYSLILEPWGDPVKPRVTKETVTLDGRPIFEFLAGEVHLFDDRFERKVTYEFDWHRSALGTIMPRKDNLNLTRFKQWLSGLHFFRINPFAMTSRTDAESLFPNVDLANIASWYRHLVQSAPKQNAEMIDSLRRAFDGFSYLQLDPAGENVRLLAAEFTKGETNSKLYFHELSDGQRCLICLYTILHFDLAKGNTVILDEPDNFISLREIQPWLVMATDMVEDGQGQIVLISHHPETIDQWAPQNGVQFVREGFGPVRVVEFHGDPSSCLSPSETIARGWQNE